MAQRRSLAWTELKVGLLIIASFILLMVAIVNISGQTSIFAKKMRITGIFPSANGLRPGGEVWLDGLLVGNVETVGINRQPGTTGRISVVMQIDEAYKDLIRSDSEISIDTIGLLGDKNVQMASGTDKGAPIEDGGILMGEETGDIRRIIQGTDDLMANLKILSDKVINISDSVDRGEGTLGKLLTKSEIHDNLNNTVLEVEKLVKDIRTGPGTVGQLISDDQILRQITTMVTRMDGIVERLDRGEGTAGKLLKDPAIFDKFEGLLVRMDGIAEKLDQGEGTLGKLLRDDSLFNDARKTMARVDGLVDTVENGNGTLGKLMKDPTLFNTVNQAASEIQKLMYDVRQDPRKYLTINFKFF